MSDLDKIINLEDMEIISNTIIVFMIDFLLDLGLDKNDGKDPSEMISIIRDASVEKNFKMLEALKIGGRLVEIIVHNLAENHKKTLDRLKTQNPKSKRFNIKTKR